MKKNILYIHLLIIAVITCCALSTKAQDATTTFQSDWQEYASKNYQEKIFVHPDKTLFLAGETLWFKVYDLEATHHTPGLSVIAYAELLDKDMQPVLQGKIPLEQGKGSGSFILPNTIASGNYQLRCYTSWMKNFDPALFFHQQITIVNTFRQGAADSTSTPALTFRFFPEGGNLVYGLTSRLAFKALGRSLSAQLCTGAIIADQRDTISRFRTTHGGMGSLLFSPQKGRKYSAVITSSDTTIRLDLPDIYDDGFVIRLIDESGDKIKVLVSNTRTSGENTIYLLTHNKQQLKDLQVNHLENNQATFFIDKSVLGDGICHLTLFNAYRTPVCERLYCAGFSHTNQLSITPQLSQPSFNKRSKASLSLSTTDDAGLPMEADLSLSVFLIDSLQDIPKEDIVCHLLLSSELKGHIDDPLYYIRDSSAAARGALDDLLLTQGWSRFRWDEVLQHKKPYFEFLPETNGPLIAGRLVDRTTGRAAPPTISYLSVPGKYFTFGAARSRPDGSIIFNTKSFYGNNDIIVQTNSLNADSIYRIDIASPFYEKPADWHTTPFALSPGLESQLLDRSIAIQADNAYLQEKKRQWLQPKDFDTLAFYGHGDHEYRLDDYTHFQTLEEVMREYVEEVHVPKQSGKFHFRVRNNLFNVYFDDDPLMLIDGLPVYDAEKILEISPLKFRQVDVVARKFFTGPLTNDGIVSYRTYDGNLAGYQLDPNAIAVHYDGLQLQQEFYTPPYEAAAPSPRIPDFRNVLSWVPDIETKQDGKSTLSFFTSDIPGTYALFVQGITSQGLPGSRIITFTVK